MQDREWVLSTVAAAGWTLVRLTTYVWSRCSRVTRSSISQEVRDIRDLVWMHAFRGWFCLSCFFCHFHATGLVQYQIGGKGVIPHYYPCNHSHRGLNQTERTKSCLTANWKGLEIDHRSHVFLCTGPRLCILLWHKYKEQLQVSHTNSGTCKEMSKDLQVKVINMSLFTRESPFSEPESCN